MIVFWLGNWLFSVKANIVCLPLRQMTDKFASKCWQESQIKSKHIIPREQKHLSERNACFQRQCHQRRIERGHAPSNKLFFSLI